MPLVTLTRERNFRALVIPGLAGAVARCLLAVLLVLRGWSFWAVVSADLVATLIVGLATQVARPIPVRFQFDWADAWEYLQFGLPLLGSGLVAFLIFNMDNFLVGYRMGSRQLGYYALVFNWGSFICVVLAGTVNSVMLPTLSAMQRDPEAMRRCYLKAVDLAAFVSVVANTTLLANAHYFLVTLLAKGSDKWVPATLSLQILCIYGVVRSLIEPLGPYLMACGQTKTLLNAAIVNGSIEAILLFFVLRTGRIELVATAVLFAYTAQSFVYMPFLRRTLGVYAKDILAQVWPVVPVLVGGCLMTTLLPKSLVTTIPTLAARGVLTALVAALIHGFCTRFRWFQETGRMFVQHLACVRARTNLINT
jgi:O-antigen/teichoic acid export membrane protein